MERATRDVEASKRLLRPHIWGPDHTPIPPRRAWPGLGLAFAALAIAGCATLAWFWEGKHSRELSAEQTLQQLHERRDMATVPSLLSRARIHAEHLIDAVAACQVLDGKPGDDARIVLDELDKRIDQRRQK